MTWVLTAAAVAIAGGGIGAVEANQNREKEKGIQGKAYGIASKNLDISQINTREGVAEGSVQRGLTGAGDVNAAGAPGMTTPSPGGASTLGGQVGKDLAVQQSLEVQNLSNENTAQLQQINASADASEVSSIASGIAGAARAGSSAPSTPVVGPSASATPASLGLGSSVVPGPYPASFGGIDPVNPLGRGAWSAPNTTGGFNINNPSP
jgi:hypothetical protein